MATTYWLITKMMQYAANWWNTSGRKGELTRVAITQGVGQTRCWRRWRWHLWLCTRISQDSSNNFLVGWESGRLRPGWDHPGGADLAIRGHEKSEFKSWDVITLRTHISEVVFFFHEDLRRNRYYNADKIILMELIDLWWNNYGN